VTADEREWVDASLEEEMKSLYLDPGVHGTLTRVDIEEGDFP
jgi:hypothetical protein